MDARSTRGLVTPYGVARLDIHPTGRDEFDTLGQTSQGLDAELWKLSST
jgi:hypothetical protein